MLSISDLSVQIIIIMLHYILFLSFYLVLMLFQFFAFF